MCFRIDHPPYIPGTSPGTSVTFAQPGSGSVTVVSINDTSSSMFDLDSFDVGDSVSRPVADDEELVFPPIIENGDFHRLNPSEAQVIFSHHSFVLKFVNDHFSFKVKCFW